MVVTPSDNRCTMSIWDRSSTEPSSALPSSPRESVRRRHFSEAARYGWPQKMSPTKNERRVSPAERASAAAACRLAQSRDGRFLLSPLISFWTGNSGSNITCNLNTEWSIWSQNTVCWHPIKSSAATSTYYIKAQLLFQCQQKFILDPMDHPVLWIYDTKS